MPTEDEIKDLQAQADQSKQASDEALSAQRDAEVTAAEAAKALADAQAEEAQQKADEAAAELEKKQNAPQE